MSPTKHSMHRVMEILCTCIFGNCVNQLDFRRLWNRKTWKKHILAFYFYFQYSTIFTYLLPTSIMFNLNIFPFTNVIIGIEYFLSFFFLVIDCLYLIIQYLLVQLLILMGSKDILKYKRCFFLLFQILHDIRPIVAF